MGPFPDAPTKSFEITACPTECTACTSADNCQSCADDYFLDGGACESVKDCLATEYETAGPTPTSDRECAALTECDLATDYESVAPTPTSDRQCSLKICTCAKGSHATGADCDENGTVTCTDCDALDHYLDGTPGQEDCFSCPTECTECTSADNCQACAADYFLDGGECFTVKTCLATEYETAGPTPTSDRECAAIHDCEDLRQIDGLDFATGVKTVYPFHSNDHHVQVTCKMGADGKAITLVSVNAENNFSYYEKKRLSRGWECVSNPSSWQLRADEWARGGQKSFSSYVMVVDREMDEVTLTTEDTEGQQPGTGGSCFSWHSCEASKRGRFSMDLAGTGLMLADSVEWKASGWGNGVQKVLNYERTPDSASGKCGAWCGECKPDKLVVKPDSDWSRYDPAVFGGWDTTRKPSHIEMDGNTISSNTDDWQTVVASKPLTRENNRYAVKLVAGNTYKFTVGIVTSDWNAFDAQLGGDEKSWGYYSRGSIRHNGIADNTYGGGRWFTGKHGCCIHTGDVITVVVDYDAKTLSYFVDRKHGNGPRYEHGVAFQNIPDEVYPAVSIRGHSTSTTKVQFGDLFPLSDLPPRVDVQSTIS